MKVSGVDEGPRQRTTTMLSSPTGFGQQAVVGFDNLMRSESIIVAEAGLATVTIARATLSRRTPAGRSTSVTSTS